MDNLSILDKSLDKYFNSLNLDDLNMYLINTCLDFRVSLINESIEYIDGNIVIICKNVYRANEVYDMLSQNKDLEDKLHLFLSDEFVGTLFLSSSSDYRYLRIKTILSLIENKQNIIVTHTLAYLRKELSLDRWKKSLLTIKKGDVIDKKDLEKTLLRYGYHHNFQVEKREDYSSKGFTLDFYSLDKDPVRLYFFDNEIEAIKTFDINTQRTMEELKEVTIHPLYEFFFFDDDLEKVREASRGTDDLENMDLVKLERFIDCLDPVNITSLAHSLNFVSNFKSVKDAYDTYIAELTEISELEEVVDNLYTLDELISNEHRMIYFNNELLEDNQNVINLSNNEVINYNSNLVNLKKDLSNSKRLFILEKNQTMIKTLETMEIEPYYISSYSEAIKGKANVINHYYGTSFETKTYTYLSSKSIYREYIKRKATVKLDDAQKIKSLDEIMIGDYVVHVDYGIGIYRGIKSIDLDGIINDYIYIEYRDNEILYVPVDKFDLILKYSSSDSYHPEINSINSTSWAKTKAKARKRIKELAFNLVAVYNERNHSNGYKCEEDTAEQYRFENDFSYALTRDQQTSLDEIKADMEKARPMDRLLCGDVGFGKTEVAMRAAFKMCTNLKQVAYLCPTTILARQHYLSYKDRFAAFGYRVELISRFVDAKKQKAIMEDLKEGKVDMVIGTHRLLNSDFSYKDLGLLIIDEEQRFGVNQKEKIRSIKANVDLLSLSATPIPRTLQMSIMGIKDISTINTAPGNRLPVQTYVLRHNQVLIKSAIEKELARNGQVFYMHNNVDRLEEKMLLLHTLVPNARITIAHGKMTKTELENTISKFIDKEYDILVCTTIIETGIDIANANTLIIDGAENYGLAQLYQIRGRVGRSDRLAYCYLMTTTASLTDVQDKRLDTIKEFTSLGSGVKIANRDLAIRGAGDVLGAEQSGFINDIGIDLYMRLLNEEIEEVKGITKQEETVPQVVLGNKHIPDEYVDVDPIKMKMHKEIYHLETLEDYQNLYKEFTDIYGTVDSETNEFMLRTLLNRVLRKFKAKANNKGYQYFEIILPRETSAVIDGVKLMETCINLSSDIYLSTVNKEVHIKLDKLKIKDYHIMTIRLLENYLGE